MSEMLQEHPFAARDDALFLTEMNAITRWHLEACPEYRRIWSTWSEAESVAQLPFLHVGVFKHILFRTNQSEVEHERTLLSSSTTGGKPSSEFSVCQSCGLTYFVCCIQCPIGFWLVC